jgi:hypothetical protein
MGHFQSFIDRDEYAASADSQRMESAQKMRCGAEWPSLQSGRYG